MKIFVKWITPLAVGCSITILWFCNKDTYDNKEVIKTELQRKNEIKRAKNEEVFLKKRKSRNLADKIVCSYNDCTLSGYPGPCKIETDVDGDGHVDSIEIYSYDRSGKKIQVEENDKDNKKKRFYTYDSRGRIADEILVNNKNNKREYIARHSYDNFNNSKIEYLDPSNDRIRSIKVIRNNELGHAKREETDIDANGVIDTVMIQSLDSNKNIELIQWDTDANGEIDRIERYIYNTQGTVIRSEFGKPDGSNIEGISKYKYNNNDTRVSIEGDTNSDGLLDFIYRYSYQEKDSSLTKTIDLKADGEIEASTRFIYGCWKTKKK